MLALIFINTMNVISPLRTGVGGFLMNLSHQMEVKFKKVGVNRNLQSLGIPSVSTYREVSYLSKGTQLMSRRAKIRIQSSESRPWSLNHSALYHSLTFHTILNKGNPRILGINTDLYNFSGGQPDNTYQILTFDQVVPLLGMILLSHCSSTQRYRRIFTIAVCMKYVWNTFIAVWKPKGIRQARSSIWQRREPGILHSSNHQHATKWDLASRDPELPKEQQP